ncbi:hypothetical protein QJU23_09385 [Pasteurella atlantica]|uniref:Uncharacterized protein n=2 Tax=Pasteurellaceae TaxID=712 RepID=A0ACC6HP38_9PAST|nr:hypothetical protein [Pasteurella atlantica]MDP8052625.1 hypothetical protein [Pasteurella atlantica]MDP8105775.1 hypothetical protein [Pasteurella atlantica]MDP8149283.1 hypothetical protein [Pasteurella atlantica]
MSKLLLMIKNPNSLEKGTVPSHIFNHKGGTVGSSSNSSWYIDNYIQNISPSVFTIFFVDGEYCIEAHDTGIFINYSHKCLEVNSTVRLKTGDSIKISNYIIEAKIIDDTLEPLTYESSLLSILAVKDMLLLSPVDDKPNKVEDNLNKTQSDLLLMENYHIIRDPIELLEKNERTETTNDLMSFYDNQGLISKKNLNNSCNEAHVYDVSRMNTGVVPTFVSKSSNEDKYIGSKPSKKENTIEISTQESEVEILDPLVLLDNLTIEDK